MANIFAELQMAASNQNNTVSDARQKMNEILRLFLEQPDREDNVSIFAEIGRNLKPQTLLDCDAFMINPEDDLLFIPEDLMEIPMGVSRTILSISRKNGISSKGGPWGCHGLVWL